jgi:uncharacterized membrane protein YdbT with pleckstrin-like domain
MDEKKFPRVEPPANLLRLQEAARSMSDSMAPVREAMAKAAEAAAPSAAVIESLRETESARRYSMSDATERMLAMERADRQRQRDIAEATIASSELLGALVQQSLDADKREQEMLWWSKVSGVAAIAASVLAVIAIVVTVMVA